MKEYNISSRLTFSNSLLREEHLSDKKCNDLCKLFSQNADPKNGVIIYSDLLLSYLKENYPHLYFVSSTTKVLTEFSQLVNELDNDDFSYVVPDFRLNKAMDNVFLTPHLAGSLGQEVDRMGAYMAEEYSRVAAGEAPKWEVSLKMLETMA